MIMADEKVGDRPDRDLRDSDTRPEMDLYVKDGQPSGSYLSSRGFLYPFVRES